MSKSIGLIKIENFTDILMESLLFDMKVKKLHQLFLQEKRQGIYKSISKNSYALYHCPGNIQLILLQLLDSNFTSQRSEGRHVVAYQNKMTTLCGSVEFDFAQNSLSLFQG